MKSNYKRLGNYIRQVDVRNRDLVVNKLLGLSIAKQFITSIANTTGTDMSTYKIVQPRQFGYVPVTSRNGDKITIALYEGESPCIISQAYVVFEVIDETELLPEYLMMWFRRPEFDRYARFKSHGSAREVFEWSEMCEVLLPVSSILLRLAVERLCNELGETGAIDKMIGSLVQKGLPTIVQKVLDAVRVIGNKAVHPGQIAFDVDDRATAETLMKLLNIITERLITEPKEIDGIFDALPQSVKDSIEKRDKE